MNRDNNSISNLSHYENDGNNGDRAPQQSPQPELARFFSVIDENEALGAAVGPTEVMAKKPSDASVVSSLVLLANGCDEKSDSYVNVFQHLVAKLHQGSSSSPKRVTLNVGGYKHEVMWRTLEKLPNSRLGRLRYAHNLSELEELCDDWDVKLNEIYFDRHPSSFGTVINYYRTGKLHLLEEMCTLAFTEDLKYWGISDCFLESCCHMKYHQKRDTVLEEMRKEEEAEQEILVSDEKFGTFMPKVRKKIWNLMENPQTSHYARVNFEFIVFFDEKNIKNPKKI